MRPRGGQERVEGRELAKERGASQDFREFNIVLGASADSAGGVMAS